MAEVPERFEHAGGDVGTTRVEHGVVIGERDFGQDFAIDVAIEGRPAAVAVLHSQQPIDGARSPRKPLAATPRGPFAPGRSGPWPCRRCPGRSRCDIRSTSRPASRFRLAMLQSPGRRISRSSSQFTARSTAGDSAGTPASASAMSVSAVSQTGEKHGCRRSVSLSWIIRSSICFMRPDHFRVVVGYAETAQHDRVVDHRRKNGPDAVAVDVALAHPGDGFAHRPAAQGSQPPALEELQRTIDAEKEIRPGEPGFGRRVRRPDRLRVFEKEFPNAHRLREVLESADAPRRR